MSRVGLKPISLPEKVAVKLDGRERLRVKSVEPEPPRIGPHDVLAYQPIKTRPCEHRNRGPLLKKALDARLGELDRSQQPRPAARARGDRERAAHRGTCHESCAKGPVHNLASFALNRDGVCPNDRMRRRDHRVARRGYPPAHGVGRRPEVEPTR